MSGLKAGVRMEGDTFEMEDVRPLARLWLYLCQSSLADFADFDPGCQPTAEPTRISTEADFRTTVLHVASTDLLWSRVVV
jgi:hypothetical protein